MERRKVWVHTPQIQRFFSGPAGALRCMRDKYSNKLLAHSLGLFISSSQFPCLVFLQISTILYVVHIIELYIATYKFDYSLVHAAEGKNVMHKDKATSTSHEMDGYRTYVSSFTSVELPIDRPGFLEKKI